MRKARADFDAAFHHVEGLRDLLAHLDGYAVGEGSRQTGKRMPPLTKEHLWTLVSWTDDGRMFVRLGDQHLDLRTAAHAAMDLARLVEQVRTRYLARTEKEAKQAAGATVLARTQVPPSWRVWDGRRSFAVLDGRSGSLA